MLGLTAPAPAAMSMWVVTANPSDHPGKYVARRHEVARGTTTATDDVIVDDTLDKVRWEIPAWAVRFDRAEDDEPQIVEVWL